MKVAFASLGIWLSIVLAVFMFADALYGVMSLPPLPTPVERGPVVPSSNTAEVPVE